MNIEPLVPAYGRDYKSIKAAQADWDANKDFKMYTGAYINKQDAVRYSPNTKSFRIRYDKCRKTGWVKL